jgi:murein DD-endopeptidase MepM/ murein hydrolase activator NlpD
MANTILLQPPVRGQWAIMNPPGHAKLAFDFLTVDDRKSPYKDVSLLRHIVSSIPVDATLAWNMPVFAVMDGTVVAASDGTPDRERISMAKDLIRLLLFGPKLVPPFSALGGNYVILKCEAVFPLYAHLKNGSVLVRAGDVVRAGDLLGRIGNSGASLQPHLHFQVMHSADPFPLFKNLVPFALSGARRSKDKQWESIVNGTVHSGDHLQL